MRIVLLLALVGFGLLAGYLIIDLGAVSQWAAEQQRSFQNQMASAVRGLRSGEPGAYLALLLAAGSYGIVHAVGPGHGKYLIGGVGLGTSVRASRLLSVALVSSIAQAIWAILLVYGGFLLLEVSARQMTVLAEDILAPASYLIIASVGLILFWRGTRSLFKGWRDTGHAHHDHCCNHAHGPTPHEVAKLESVRDVATLVASIAIRPCTGAIFLLVIAWQMDIRLAGALAVLAMGLGTASLTSLVALSSIAARTAAFASAGNSAALPVLASTAQLTAGALIVWFSLLLFQLTL
ncbi:MAG: hypothetical protein AAFQ66_14845 [Pseudomonadota bacterium]